MYSRELRKLILHISCNQSICMHVKSKNINSLQCIFFLGFFFTSIYMHKYITKYQFGITKCTQNFLYAVNVRYFFFNMETAEIMERLSTTLLIKIRTNYA